MTKATLNALVFLAITGLFRRGTHTLTMHNCYAYTGEYGEVNPAGMAIVNGTVQMQDVKRLTDAGFKVDVLGSHKRKSIRLTATIKVSDGSFAKAYVSVSEYGMGDILVSHNGKAEYVNDKARF